MNWFLIALLCAFFTSCCDGVAKRLTQDNDEWIVGSILLLAGLPVFFPVFLSQEVKPVSVELVQLLVVALPLEVLGYYLFLTAIRIGPLSLTVPLLAFTPVFTIFTSWLILGEEISLKGAFGISLVTFGAYILNGDLVNQSALAPLRAVVSHPGSRRMLLTALVWSVTSTLGKKGILIYGAVPFGFVLLVLVATAFCVISAVLVRSGRAHIAFKRQDIWWWLLGGIVMSAMELTHFISLSMAPVSYMIAVKRLSLVFGVLFGWLFFHEVNIRYRLVGACVMVAGVFLVY